MHRILITGGAGFIGGYLIQECDKQEIDFLMTGRPGRLPAKYSGRERPMDIMDQDRIEEILEEYQPDIIIHLAAIASVVHRDPVEIYRINVLGTENLMNAAAKKLPEGSRMILLSTAGVYGNQAEKKLYESLPFNPVNHYSCSKMVTEVMSRQYRDHLDICIVRPFNVIGIGQSKNFLIPKLVHCFKKREQQIQIGNLASIRDYVSVEFCAKVLVDLALAQNAPEIINICSGQGHSCQEVIDILKELTGFKPRVVPVSNLIRPNEIWNLVGDNTILRSIIQNRYHNLPLKEILSNMLKE